MCVSTVLVLGYVSTGASMERMPDPDNFWAFKPPQQKELPDVINADWPANSIDLFILAKLEKNKLAPSAAVRKEELIRRATFDLLGLPPTPAEVNDFVQDKYPSAYERLVDRLLHSSHYGEKWGQLWLDVIRFSESEGFEYDRQLPGAWRFRDYVIRSFNEDKPFDQFIQEQIAGDEMDNPSDDAFTAAGFHRFGPVRRNAGNPEIALSRNEVLTERTDIIGSAFMGITMGCARCHDHKLDPVSQKDYYSLQAFVASTQEYNHFLVPQDVIHAWQTKTDSINEETLELKDRYKDIISDEEKAQIQKRLAELKLQIPAQLPTILSTKNDPEKRTEIRILNRGVWEFKGELVQMRPPDILSKQNPLLLPPEEPRPRTALAEWLTSPDNPLTARVLVNRIWLNHFGNGIVNTPNDFGYNGERPSHPELLDYLALQLVENNWQIKNIHRQIMLSNTYRQSSRTTTSEHAEKIDPSNRLLWKFNRRRLQAEEIRDALLAVSGRLNKEMYGESIILPVEEEMVNLLYDPKQWAVTKDQRQQDRRSVYLIAKRNLRLPFMETFDQPTLQNSCGRRESSTHAPQALELLNGDIANDLAVAFAQRLQSETNNLAQAQIEKAWMLIAGRPPAEQELELAKRFLKNHPLREFTLAMFNLNDFLYVR